MKKTLFILTLATMLFAQEVKLYPIQLGSMLFTHIEMVDTDEGRIKGLMNRKKLAYDGGMLFVFQKEDMLSFSQEWTRKDSSMPTGAGVAIRMVSTRSN